MERMDAQEAARTFGELFPAIYRRFCRRVRPTDFQPTPEALAILNHLAHSGPLTVTEAARHMERSQAAMSELIARLVKRGLLARLPDERDRRRILIWLTPAGRDYLRVSGQVLSEELLTAALAELSAADRRKLITAVQALLAVRPRKRSPSP